MKSAKDTDNSDANSEERARGSNEAINRASEARQRAPSDDSGRGHSENSLTYTKEQVQVVERSAHL